MPKDNHPRAPDSARLIPNFSIYSCIFKDNSVYYCCLPSFKLLAQRQPLVLVTRPDSLPVDLRRGAEQALEDQPSDYLAILQQERHFVRAHLEHGVRAFDVIGAVTETRVEEARVIDPELAHRGIIGHHLRRERVWNAHTFFRSKNVKVVGIQNQSSRA